MKVKWDIVKDNIGTGNYEAIMKKQTGQRYEPYLLFVHEYGNGFHGIFCTEYKYFNRIDIPYNEVYPEIEAMYKGRLSYKEIHVKALEYACNKMEKNFYEQVDKLLDFLSD